MILLKQVWQILDQKHEELDHIRQDDAYKQWETAHRKHGESMNTWINNLKKVKLELEAQDPEMTISRRYYASKLMHKRIPCKGKSYMFALQWWSI